MRDASASAAWLMRAAKQEMLAEAASAPLVAALTLLGALVVTGHILKRYWQRCKKWRHGSGYAYAQTRIACDDEDEGLPRLALGFTGDGIEAGGMLALPMPAEEATSQMDACNSCVRMKRGENDGCKALTESRDVAALKCQGAVGDDNSPNMESEPQREQQALAEPSGPPAFVTLDQIAEQQQMQQREPASRELPPVPVPPPPPMRIASGLAPRSGLYAPPAPARAPSSAAGSERRGGSTKVHRAGGYAQGSRRPAKR